MTVGEFEKQTSYCPLYLAWCIVDEARSCFRTEIPGSYAAKLARRAERVFAKQPFWQRKLRFRQSEAAAANREFILKFMRHWLAGVLARENPVLFRQLPESFKIGHPLPETPPGAHGVTRPTFGSSTLRSSSATEDGRGLSPHRPARRFVHGCGFTRAEE